MIKQKKKVPIKLIMWLVIGVAIAIISVSTTFYFVNINKKLSAPTNISILELSNNQKFLKFDSVAGAVRYQYVIISEDNDINLNYETTKTEVEITSSVSTITNYEINIRALGKTANSKSSYSKINFTHDYQISKPNVSILENTLTFNIQDYFYEPVDLTVTLYYKQKNSTENFSNLSLSKNNQTDGLLQSNYYGPASGYFDLSQFPTGQYLMYITVSTNNELYTTSPISTILNYSC